jgi:hypothetical protein
MRGGKQYTRRRGPVEQATKRDGGIAWPQPREREEGGPITGNSGACVVGEASNGASFPDSGQAAAPADKDGETAGQLRVRQG